jgi:hypothetical protein
MPEGLPNAATGKSKPDGVVLKDVLRPSNLIIAMSASVLFILLGWYFLILKPALDANNPMDIRLTKKPFSNTPFPEALTLEPEAETQLPNTDIKPQTEGVQTEKKPEMVTPETVKAVGLPSARRGQLTARKMPIKSAKAKSAIDRKMSSAQRQNSPPTNNVNLENKPNENLWPENTETENIVAENLGAEKMNAVKEVVEDEEADATEDIKAFAAKWKESIFVHATQPICTQVQIAMNQCPN